MWKQRTIESKIKEQKKWIGHRGKTKKGRVDMVEAQKLAQNKSVVDEEEEEQEEEEEKEKEKEEEKEEGEEKGDEKKKKK